MIRDYAPGCGLLGCLVGSGAISILGCAASFYVAEALDLNEDTKMLIGITTCGVIATVSPLLGYKAGKEIDRLKAIELIKEERRTGKKPPQPKGVGAGYEGRVRIGRELGTNLLLDLLAAQRAGTQGLIQLQVLVTDRFTTGGTVSVENFPVSREAGFRLWLYMSYLLHEAYAIGLRIGFAARDIHRIGVNVGGDIES